MELILISSCLLGQPVRYDGKGARSRHPLILRWLAEQRLVPLCPEMSGGLPTPRPAAEISGGQGEQVLNGSASVISTNQQDFSREFVAGAELALKKCQKQNIKLAILKARSPSCGSQSTYDGNFSGQLVSGQGVTSALLRSHGIKVYDEEMLLQAESYLAELERNSR
ncbi:DUF523 domain-containing protein [Motiliproteus sp. MSK22-1]|uniref:DUF523 domain-containing protein n=1 Tax=Motiliproteus sp. MSK22-1 TaxID=1897630 RepID=UPI000978AEFB|nr:DUF523 domain-containing protein [Motiliproteus sp. MSK22-1]OMH25899.1 hypothetical protein BGP75_25650 [Motiliproteus sp. MSK22-1]